jgi:transposase InsO family protein
LIDPVPPTIDPVQQLLESVDEVDEQQRLVQVIEPEITKAKKMDFALPSSHVHPQPSWQLVQPAKQHRVKHNKQQQEPTAQVFDINDYHKTLWHVNENSLRATAKYYGTKLTGTLQPCIPCALAKIHTHPLRKTTLPRSTVPGEQLFVDISHLSYPSLAGKKYWLLILDDATDMAFSHFLKQKSDAPEILLQFISNMNSTGKPVKYIRLDNSGENQRLRNLTTESNLNIQFEFTAPSTPQQNGRVERKFSILYGYMRSILNQANCLLVYRRHYGLRLPTTLQTSLMVCVLHSTKFPLILSSTGKILLITNIFIPLGNLLWLHPILVRKYGENIQSWYISTLLGSCHR